MITLFIVNSPPLRLGARLQCAARRHYYSLERMPGIVHLKGGNIGVCGTCMDARGLRGEDLVAGASHSTMEELTDWTLWADKVLVF